MSDSTKEALDPAVQAQFDALKKQLQELEEKSSSVEFTRVYLAVGHDTVLGYKVFVTHIYPKKSNKHHRNICTFPEDRSIEEVQLMALHTLFGAAAHTEPGSKIKITMKDTGLPTILSNPQTETTEEIESVRDELYALGTPVEFSGDEDNPLFEKAGMDVLRAIQENRQVAQEIKEREANANSDGSGIRPSGDGGNKAAN